MSAKRLKVQKLCCRLRSKLVNNVLGLLKREGSFNSMHDHVTSFEERQRVIQKEKYDRFETLHQRIDGGGQ